MRMPSYAKCPNCGEPVAKARIEKIDTDANLTKLHGPLPFAGLAFVCPNPQCNVLLPIWPITTGEGR